MYESELPCNFLSGFFVGGWVDVKVHVTIEQFVGIDILEAVHAILNCLHLADNFINRWECS